MILLHESVLDPEAAYRTIEGCFSWRMASRRMQAVRIISVGPHEQNAVLPPDLRLAWIDACD